MLVALVIALAPAGAIAGVEVPELRSREPLAHGLRVGDVVVRELLLALPPGARLEEDSLPQPRPEGAIELRAVEREGAADASRQRLLLRYQLMHSPEALRVYELPTVELRVQVAGPGGHRLLSLRADAWPLVAGPLVPEPPPERRGLGPLQPDRPLPPLPLTALRWQAAAWGSLATLALAWLLWRHLLGPWVWRRQRPFARAWRALRRAEGAGPDSLTLALRRLHQALDEDAGRPLQAEHLVQWLARRPAFAPLQAELAGFFAASATHFYAPRAAAAETAQGLARQLEQVKALAQRLAQQESRA